MPNRTMGSSNPVKAAILKNDPRFEASQTHYTAEGRSQMAKAHTANRNAHMLELLCGLSAMASAASGGPALRLRNLRLTTVNFTGAIRQRYSYPEPDAGAHLMPGQLRLSGLPPWEYVPHQVGRIFLLDLFEEVDRLHANFNRADSAAEDGPNGLKELAVEAATQILRDSSARPGGRANRELVWNVHKGLWLPGVEKSLTLAIDKKDAKPQVPSLKHATPTFDPKKGPESFDPRLLDPDSFAAINAARQYEWNISETILIARDNLRFAADGPGVSEFGELASRAESALKGDAQAIETVG
jgi:hypothetical protein